MYLNRLTNINTNTSSIEYGEFTQDPTVFLVLADTGLSLGLLEVFIEEVGTAPPLFSFMPAKMDERRGKMQPYTVKRVLLVLYAFRRSNGVVLTIFYLITCRDQGQFQRTWSYKERSSQWLTTLSDFPRNLFSEVMSDVICTRALYTHAQMVS